MTRTITLIALAAVAMPPAGMAQPGLGSPEDDAELRIIDRITDIRARTGPESAALIEPLTELADYYYETGNFALAVPTIDRAAGLIRNNYGLSSLDQAPLLKLLLEIERGAGDIAGAWDTEQQLLSLARENPEDLRTVPILREIGDTRIAMLERYVAGDFVPEVQLGCFYKAPGHHMASCYAGSKSDAAASLLLDATEMYRDAAEVIRRLNVYPSAALVELQTGLARNYFLHGPPRTAESAYELGRVSLQRLYDYEVEHSGSQLDRLSALVRIADWDLVYVRQPLAIETYERVLAQLKAGGAAQEEISRLFSPPTPIVIPSFVRNRLSTQAAEPASGHIDVTFEITKYGRSRRIDVLERSNDASDDAVDELTQTIKLSRFRPRINADGDFDDTAVTLRYYLQN